MTRGSNTCVYLRRLKDPELRIQDWRVTYDELEPYYDRFESLCGVGGKAGNITGQIRGNPFEAWRSREYPNPPLKDDHYDEDLDTADDYDG